MVEKGEIAQNEQFHLFLQCFLCNLYLKIAKFQLISASSLNCGRSQNGVFGNRLKIFAMPKFTTVDNIDVVKVIEKVEIIQ